MFCDPKKIVEQSAIHSGQKVADFGAGAGYFVLEIAKSLMSTGIVYAIDINKDLLNKIKKLANEHNFHNVEIIWGNFEDIGGSKLSSNSVDICFVCNVFFQVENKVGAINEIKRILVSGGRVVFVDWSDSFSNIGPKKESVVKESTTVEMFEKNGFAKEKSIVAGSHHYGIIFKKL